MRRTRLSVFGMCLALVACGEKFVAQGGSGGNGGTSGAGRAGASVVGEAGTSGSAGHDNAEAGEAGEGNVSGGGSGGVPANGGAGGLLGYSGAGSSGSAGTGGLLEPKLPQLGLLVWLRADRGIQQTDGLVQAWQDQSGNQMNAVQLSPDTRPRYLPTGFDGRPTLEFDGKTQFLKFGSGFGDFSKGLAGLIVAKPTKADCASMIELSNGSELDDVAFSMWENKWSYEVATELIHDGNVGLGLFSVYSVNHRQLGLSELRINGSILGSRELPLPAQPESGVRRSNFIGHTLYGSCAYFEGQISEIILYSRTLTDTELVGIEDYLTARWAISEQSLPP